MSASGCGRRSSIWRSVGRLAAQLQPRLEHHAQARRADRVAERLQAAVGVDRQLAVEVEDTVELVAPRRAPLGEPEVLHEHELGDGEAVVHLGQRELGARVGDAGLRVRVARAVATISGKVV